MKEELKILFSDNNPLIRRGPPVAKASVENESDGEGRKRGERLGLDTPVVHAVNDGY